MRNALIHVIAGARPNFMKVSPVVSALQSRKRDAMPADPTLRVSIIHTGQHYDKNMSEIFFQELGIPGPDRYLEVGSGSHADQTARIMIAYEKVLVQDRPDLVIVVGDVNSTIACSLTARKLGVRVAHVEAGLRSFDMEMPEEINRKLTDVLCDLLFVSEESGVRNLRNEGIPEDRIFFVGNVMIDTLFRNVKIIEEDVFTPSTEVSRFCARWGQYGVLTLHRPSNVDNRDVLSSIWNAFREISNEIPILFPIHPRTRAKIKEFGLDPGHGIIMLDPIGYLDMLYAVRRAVFVLTDSGGLQEETTALGVPCITIRENTERPVTIELGTNHLAGTDPGTIVATARDILSGKMKRWTIPDLWDGNASERIADTILTYLSRARH